MSLPITVENLSKRYKLGVTHATSIRELVNCMIPRRRTSDPLEAGTSSEFWALSDVSFELGHGEILGIVGPNGAGKSTLLKILSRITRPSRGRAIIRGRTASLLEVGTGFHPELTGYENIFLNGAVLGMRKSEIRRTLDAIISFAGVEQFIHTPVKRYSSGMFVRLAFAVAAHLDTDILIADEVLAVGDFSFQQRCLGRMQDLTREGRTVLFVSHNLGAVGRLCTRVLLLRNGKIWDIGDTKKMLMKYQGGRVIDSESCAGLNQTLSHPDLEDGAKIVDLCAMSKTGQPLEHIRTWAPITFHLQYEIDSMDVLLSLELSISTDDGHLLMVLNSSRMGHASFRNSCRRHSCRFSIEHLPLAAGRYRIGAYISVTGCRYLYRHSSIGIMQVEAKDIFGGGYPPVRPMNLVACPATCEMD